MASCFSLFRRGGSKVDHENHSYSDIDSDALTLTNSNEYDEKVKVSTSSSRVPSLAVTAIDTTSRLAALRKRLDEQDIDLYIVPSEDAHGSEYVAPRDLLRSFISGFTGSAGVVIVGNTASKFAGLWTDGRYHIQAEQQLDQNWKLFKVGITGVLSWDQWLAKDAFDLFEKDTLRIGTDSRLLPFSKVEQILASANESGNTIETVFEEKSLVTDVWTDPDLPFKDEYPPALDQPVHQHPLKFAGQTSQDKIEQVVQWLGGASIDDLIKQKQGDRTATLAKGPNRGDYYVADALDEVAWLFNLRGASIPNNPVFPAYVVVSAIDKSATLFISSALLPSDSAAYKYVTEELKFKVQDYSQVWDALRELPAGQEGASSKVVTRDAASYALISAIGVDRAEILLAGDSPVGLLKAVKNQAELQGMRNAYLRDGAAWAKWSAWLEELLVRRKKSINEYDAAQKLIDIRSRQENYAGFEAYDPICGTGPNAALPHYETPEHGSAILDLSTPFLNDSGGQYFDGTIDTTRTVHFGKPTAEQKHAFTRVLQGHIAIDTAIFPKGTTGATLDVLARSALWSDGLNYLHGTGHGIGSFLNVHEGPQGFSTTSGGSTRPVALRAGMMLSNEPGYYKTGKGGFGIRTESIIAVTKFSPKYEHSPQDGTEWFQFERFTQVPIAKNLIEWRLLNEKEKKWIHEHNEGIKRKVLPLVKGDARAEKWLKRQ
ncbi:unnamed protein product [Sympodiomycopsis kandeliae]